MTNQTKSEMYFEMVGLEEVVCEFVLKKYISYLLFRSNDKPKE